MLFATGAVQKERWIICNSCPNRINAGILLCKICGCPLTSKVALAGFGCPEGRWLPISMMLDNPTPTSTP